MSEEIVLDLQEEELEIVPASSGKRFANLIVDSLLSQGVFIGITFTVGLPAVIQNNALLTNVVYYLLHFAYYFVMESTTGKTVGKMITKTKVVKEDGSEPDLQTAFIRSISRLIPFDAFSFLGKDRVGWHDSFAKSRVVNA